MTETAKPVRPQSIRLAVWIMLGAMVVSIAITIPTAPSDIPSELPVLIVEAAAVNLVLAWLIWTGRRIGLWLVSIAPIAAIANTPFLLASHHFPPAAWFQIPAYVAIAALLWLPRASREWFQEALIVRLLEQRRRIAVDPDQSMPEGHQDSVSHG